MADCGVASRRAAERLIADGKCAVNGEIVNSRGFMIDAGSDRVTVDGVAVTGGNEKKYFMLNKPRGYVTTSRDQFGRPAVTDLIVTDARLFPVGRLDYGTTGLLLLTNDGELAYRLTHPKFNVTKTYSVRVAGEVSDETAGALLRGVDIGGYVTRPAELVIINKDGKFTDIRITVSEGKNRLIRRMCEALGFPVVSLKRTAVGDLRLGELGEGEHRALTPDEVNYLKNI